MGKRIIFLLILSTLYFSWPAPINAFSFQQISSPVSAVFNTLTEKVQYWLAFTPANKVKVLENQAQKRLETAQTDKEKVEDSIKDYQDIKNRQSSFLDKVDDSTLKEVQNQTLKEQETLTKIGNDQPDMAGTVKTVNQSVVNEIKKTVTLKEGTTAGEAFEQKATIVYAPGTGPGGEATLKFEGGGPLQFAPGTSAGGTSGIKIEGGSQGFAPGTSSGDQGGTKVEGGNPGYAPGTSDSGQGGQQVVGQ